MNEFGQTDQFHGLICTIEKHTCTFRQGFGYCFKKHMNSIPFSTAFWSYACSEAPAEYQTSDSVFRDISSNPHKQLFQVDAFKIHFASNKWSSRRPSKLLKHQRLLNCTGRIWTLLNLTWKPHNAASQFENKLLVPLWN